MPRIRQFMALNARMAIDALESLDDVFLPDGDAATVVGVFVTSAGAQVSVRQTSDGSFHRLPAEDLTMTVWGESY